ncbi:MAG: class I SAM-dependent methyltransferase [Candidatus Zambryskibacteria bacterium]|nr:class I SAM-dependent methyltransferase [Candidatus Zambryskibacteria bacterium]
MDQLGLYHQQVGERPNLLVVSILAEYVTTRGVALDLGAGNLRDSKFLKKVGFNRVVAVDYSHESVPFLTEGIELEISPIQVYKPEASTFDFVVSCNTLFFLNHEEISHLFKNIFVGLRAGGVFTCNVLGPEDDWIVKEGRQVGSFTRTSLRLQCKDFKILGMREFKHRAAPPGTQNIKFWYQWSIALQKPA